MHASPGPATSSRCNYPGRAAAVARTASSAGPAPSAPGALGEYFRELSGLDVMSKEEEQAAAARIVALRRELWRALLGHASFTDRVCALAWQLMPAAAAPDDAGEALAEVFSGADVDAAVAERILAEVDSGELAADESALARFRADTRAHHTALVAAKKAFVTANLRLVVTIARRYGRGALPLEDLIQEGNIGLMKAVDRFDHRRGFRFSTYGAWWIRHAIGRALIDKGRGVRLPVQIVQGCAKIKRAGREFEVLHGRPPTDEELAELTGVPCERIRRMRWALVEGQLSLEQPLSGHGELALIDTIAATDVLPTDALEHASEVEQLNQAFAALKPIEVDIVRARVGIGCDDEASLAELAERHGLSRERIRQIQEQAHRKLRRELTRRPLP